MYRDKINIRVGIEEMAVIAQQCLWFMSSMGIDRPFAIYPSWIFILQVHRDCIGGYVVWYVIIWFKHLTMWYFCWFNFRNFNWWNCLAVQYKLHFTQIVLKGPYADHILIPQGSTGSITFSDIKWKPIFFLFQIQNFSFKFFVVLEIWQKMRS